MRKFIEGHLHERPRGHGVHGTVDVIVAGELEVLRLEKADLGGGPSVTRRAKPPPTSNRRQPS